MKLREYFPTIVCAGVLIMDRLLELFQDTLPALLGGLSISLYLMVNALIVFIVKHLPVGPWEVSGGFISSPNFSGWLVSSLIILAPILALNYFLVVRKQYISARTLLIALLLVLSLLVTVEYWAVSNVGKTENPLDGFPL